MRLVDAARPTFARHETFHPRYGWFRKAYAFAAEDSRIFSADDAPVRMGVGKNMVRAIRFWGRAAKLVTVDSDLAEPPRPWDRSYRYRPRTFLGRWLGSVHGGSGHALAAALAAARSTEPPSSLVGNV